MKFYLYRLFFLSILFISWGEGLFAGHLLGGEMYYECTDEGKYLVTMVLYRDCATSNALTLFDSSLGAQYKATVTVYRGSSRDPFIDSIALAPPEITPIPPGNITFCTEVPKRCVEKGIYTFEVDLPPSDETYYLVYQRCCRGSTIDNILEPDANGITIKTEITPLSQSICASGMKFRNAPPRLLCVDETWNFDHSVEDLNENIPGRIEYSLCKALKGGDHTTTNGLAPNPDDPPPYNSLQYVGGNYSFTSPFGSSPAMTIDPQTGYITVTPQFSGRYVVAVCASKYDDNGNLLFSIKRDFEYRVVDCQRKVTAGIESDSIDGGIHYVRVCGDSTIQLVDQSSQEEFIRSYNWYFEIDGELREFMEKDPVISFPSKGTYDGILVLNEGRRCPDTAFISIDVLGGIVNDFTFDYDTCTAGPVYFEGNASTENGSIRMHEWVINNEDSIFTIQFDHIFQESGEKRITYRVRDDEGCESIATREIPYYPIPNEILVIPEYRSRCTPATVVFHNESYPLDNNYDIDWRFGGSLNSSAISPEVIFEDAGNYPVYISILSPIGCIYEGVLDDTITILQSPQAGFDISPAGLNQFTDEVRIIDRSNHASVWEYSMSTSSRSSAREPAFGLPGTGSYWIEQIVTHENGCTDTFHLDFEVPFEAVYYLPNAFTPDQDGRNDVYMGKGDFDSFQNFEMSIFNRWGERVFHTKDPNVGWNGSKDNTGLILPNDVYVVRVSFNDLEGKQLTLKRFATLIR